MPDGSNGTTSCHPVAVIVTSAVAFCCPLGPAAVMWYHWPMRQIVRAVTVIAGSLALAACVDAPAGDPEPGTSVARSADVSASTTASAPGQPGSYTDVTFRSQGGGTRAGRLFGDGRVAVVLSHMGRAGDSQDDWQPFAEELAERGYRALTYARAADASREDFADHWRDVLGAVAFLRDNGAETVIAGGASIGAVASLHAAGQPGNGINAVLWLAGVVETDSYEFTEPGVAAIDCPVMFVSGSGDAYGSAESARILHSWASDGELLFIDSYRHGTDIYAEGGANAGELSRAMLEFVEKMKGRQATC
jgi:pimeloyl-ACP methyl ester carboxylesterase